MTYRIILIALALWAPCAAQEAQNLIEAREGHVTKLLRKDRSDEKLTPPPEELFSLVHYPTSLGEMAGYLSKPKDPDTKSPAILWVTGGFPPGGIDDAAWEPQPIDNDQSAKAYRMAGMVMFYPAFRGNAGNPGAQEGLYGEVDDAIAAAEYLAGLDFVDPEQIYLGGHSTGGTLVLLIAAATDVFRGVISFGPVEDTRGYGQEAVPFDIKDNQETSLRAPANFLGAIRSPTFVIEGTEESNYASLRAMRAASKNPQVHFLAVEGANHFNVLTSSNRLIAEKIMAADDEDIELSEAELVAAFRSLQAADLEAADLAQLSRLRSTGVDLGTVRPVNHYLLSRDRRGLDEASRAAEKAGFTTEIAAETDDEGKPFFSLTLTKKFALRDLDAVFAASAATVKLAAEHKLQYDGWGAE